MEIFLKTLSYLGEIRNSQELVDVVERFEKLPSCFTTLTASSLCHSL